MNIVSLLLVVLMLLFGISPADTDVAVTTVHTYGPGHETHQFAAWDNGDDTHSVACDCGIEKRIEPHADKDSDGICDTCGAEQQT